MDNPPINLPGKSDIGNIYDTWQVFIFHTCTQRWSCSSIIDEFLIHLKVVNNSISFHTADQHGNAIEINQKVMAEGHTNDVIGYRRYFDDGPIVPIITYTNASCFGKDKVYIICEITVITNDGPQTISFNTKGNKNSCVRNVCFEVQGEIEVISEDRTIKVKLQNQNSESSSIEGEFGAVTLEDLHETMVRIRTLQIKTSFNLIILERKVQNTRQRFKI